MFLEMCLLREKCPEKLCAAAGAFVGDTRYQSPPAELGFFRAGLHSSSRRTERALLWKEPLQCLLLPTWFCAVRLLNCTQGSGCHIYSHLFLFLPRYQELSRETLENGSGFSVFGLCGDQLHLVLLMNFISGVRISGLAPVTENVKQLGVP